ncbi:efflux RND transporter permease subunit [candidate division KSB1 bacterium]|nr:efflux RND transporter permease subunit [candidate division KSB1 bacterium]
MKIAELSIKKPVGTILLVLSLILLSLISIPRIPISFWPEFVAPTLIVLAPYPGVGPEEIEELVAKPLEEEFSTIDGVEELETTCLDGLCRIFVRFGWGVDFDEAKLDVQERTNRARARLPREVLTPTVLQVQDFLPPGIELGFSSDKRDLNEIREFIEKKLKNRFLRLPNVANVQIFGGNEQHVTIQINPNRLAALGLSLNTVNTALISENLNVPAGKLTTGYRNYFVRTMGKFKDLTDLENMIVATPKGAPVYLKNVARIGFENKEAESMIRLNGKELVGLAIREKSGGNTVAMVEEVRQELKGVARILPADIQLTILRDQSRFIKNSIQNVVANAALGALLAAVILFLFLGSFRNTLIIALSIPISVIGTFVLIDAFGLSINTISLGGLALGVGMVIDSSIVVLENIFRHLQEKPKADRLKTVVLAVQEVGLAVSASNLTSIVVFLPLAFLVGLFAVLLGELALTVVFSLTISVVVALTIIPLLSYKLIRVDQRPGFLGRLWQRFFEGVTQVYRATLSWALRHRILTIFLTTVTVALSLIVLLPRLDVELLPSVNEGEFRIELLLPESAQLALTDQMVRQIETEVKSRPEVTQVYSVVGVLSVRGELKANAATITVNLKPAERSRLAQVMADIRQRWQALPGAKLVVRQTDVTEGMKTSVVNVRIAGDDLATLGEVGQQALELVATVPNVVNINSSLLEGLYEFGIQIDRTRASDLGLASSQIANTIRTAVQGVTPTRLSSYGEEYDITVRMDPTQLSSVNDLLDLPLTTMKGRVLPLRSVAHISLARGPSEIKRFDQQRVVEIKADVAGRPQHEVVAEVQQKMNSLNLPPNYYLVYGGQSRGIADSFRSLLIALAIAIFMVYVVMGAQFNSFLHPLTIAATIPLALIGVVLGLYFFGAALSMNALLGMIMLVGIVVNNGIILIDYINQLRAEGLVKMQAIIQAGVTRLRPVLITSLTTIFGMLPIALGLGEGGEALQPLGAVVLGGLTTSTFLTLIVIPCVYSIVDRLSRTKYS